MDEINVPHTKVQPRPAMQSDHAVEARNLDAELNVPAESASEGEHWVERMVRRMKEIGGEEDFVLDIPPREIVEPRVLFDTDASSSTPLMSGRLD